MKRIVLIILCCLLVLTGCNKKEEHSFIAKVIEVSSNSIIVEPDLLEDERKSSDRFIIDLKDNDTIYEIDDYVKIYYDGVIFESYPAQVEATKIEKLIESKMANNKIKIEKFDPYDSNKYYEYCKMDDRIIYFDGSIKEIYIIDEKEVSLKEYISTTYQTLDDSIKHITENMDKIVTLRDGGTTIYKSKSLDLTVTTCNTTNKNKDIYFSDYKSTFNETMCK